MFKKFGTVTESFIAAECAAAITEMHGKEVNGRSLVVNPANAKIDGKPTGTTTSGQARKAFEDVADSDDDDDLPVGFALSSRVKTMAKVNTNMHKSDSDEEISFIAHYP
ncbi:hypothetical protein HDU67_005667 [Dinochytrium kinnereticum]|nr:hypothetical protein HDU67_005667 [Dinochytrium kinnereticum]